LFGVCVCVCVCFVLCVCVRARACECVCDGHIQLNVHLCVMRVCCTARVCLCLLQPAPCILTFHVCLHARFLTNVKCEAHLVYLKELDNAKGRARGNRAGRPKYE
jgi:hypothetical protein